MRISDWSSDVCSSDLHAERDQAVEREEQCEGRAGKRRALNRATRDADAATSAVPGLKIALVAGEMSGDLLGGILVGALRERFPDAEFYGVTGTQMEAAGRSEEHTSELQSLMRISYAVFCLK